MSAQPRHDEKRAGGLTVPSPLALSWEFVLQLAILIVTITFAYSNLSTRISLVEAGQLQSRSTAEETKRDLKTEIDKINVKLDLLLTDRARRPESIRP